MWPPTMHTVGPQNSSTQWNNNLRARLLAKSYPSEQGTPLRVSLGLTKQRNPGGCRTPMGDSTGDGSNSSGRIVRHGLRSKPLRGPPQWVSTLLYLPGLDQPDALAWQ